MSFNDGQLFTVSVEGGRTVLDLIEDELDEEEEQVAKDADYDFDEVYANRKTYEIDSDQFTSAPVSRNSSMPDDGVLLPLADDQNPTTPASSSSAPTPVSASSSAASSASSPPRSVSSSSIKSPMSPISSASSSSNSKPSASSTSSERLPDLARDMRIASPVPKLSSRTEELRALLLQVTRRVREKLDRMRPPPGAASSSAHGHAEEWAFLEVADARLKQATNLRTPSELNSMRGLIEDGQRLLEPVAAPRAKRTLGGSPAASSSAVQPPPPAAASSSSSSSKAKAKAPANAAASSTAGEPTEKAVTQLTKKLLAAINKSKVTGGGDAALQWQKQLRAHYKRVNAVLPKFALGEDLTTQDRDTIRKAAEAVGVAQEKALPMPSSSDETSSSSDDEPLLSPEALRKLAGTQPRTREKRKRKVKRHGYSESDDSDEEHDEMSRELTAREIALRTMKDDQTTSQARAALDIVRNENKLSRSFGMQITETLFNDSLTSDNLELRLEKLRMVHQYGVTTPRKLATHWFKQFEFHPSLNPTQCANLIGHLHFCSFRQGTEMEDILERPPTFRTQHASLVEKRPAFGHELALLLYRYRFPSILLGGQIDGYMMVLPGTAMFEELMVRCSRKDIAAVESWLVGHAGDALQGLLNSNYVGKSILFHVIADWGRETPALVRLLITAGASNLVALSSPEGTTITTLLVFMFQRHTEEFPDIPESEVIDVLTQLLAVGGPDPLGMYHIEGLETGRSLVNFIDDTDGRTPLIQAASQGFLRAVGVLLDAGADPLRKDASGDTFLFVIFDTINRDVARKGLNQEYREGVRYRLGIDHHRVHRLLERPGVTSAITITPEIVALLKATGDLCHTCKRHIRNQVPGVWHSVNPMAISVEEEAKHDGLEDSADEDIDQEESEDESSDEDDREFIAISDSDDETPKPRKRKHIKEENDEEEQEMDKDDGGVAPMDIVSHDEDDVKVKQEPDDGGLQPMMEAMAQIQISMRR